MLKNNSITFLIFILFSQIVYGQPTSLKQVQMAYADYLQETIETKNRIILIEYKDLTQGRSQIVISASVSLLVLLEKPPDEYLAVDHNIIYLYYSEKGKTKISKWMDNLYCKTKRVIGYSDIIVLSWEDFSYAPNYQCPIVEYDPIILEYMFVNGEIQEKKLVLFPLYPDRNQPKFIKDHPMIFRE